MKTNKNLKKWKWNIIALFNNTGNSLSVNKRSFLSSLSQRIPDPKKLIEQGIEETEEKIIDPIEKRVLGESDVNIAKTVFMVAVVIGALIITSSLVKKVM